MAEKTCSLCSPQLIRRLFPVIPDNVNMQVIEKFCGHTCCNKAWHNHRLRYLHQKHTTRSLMACGFHQMILLATRVGRRLFWTCPKDLMSRSETLWESCLSPTNQGKDKTKQRTIH